MSHIFRKGFLSRIVSCINHILTVSEVFFTFQGNNFASWVHDGRVCRDGSSDWIRRVIHVNDDHLCCLANLLSDTYELVRLHCKGTEPNIGCIDSNILELQKKKE